MKYTLPSPTQYMQGLLTKLIIAKNSGQELRAGRIHANMQGFAHAMGRIESYHKQRMEQGR